MSVKTRLIPVLLLKNGFLVRSEEFRIHQIIGNPYNEVRRFNEWNVDELIYLDISRPGKEDGRREVLTDPNRGGILSVLEAVSKTCFMPLTWGGRIRTLEDMRARFSRGADKVAVNTQFMRTPELIERAAASFGSQAIVAGIDAVHTGAGYQVCIAGGTEITPRHPADWAREVEARGAGEILLQSVERDGRGSGYDVPLIETVAQAVRIPVVACSGVGKFEDYHAGVQAGASAVAAANIWHFKELSDRQGKRALQGAGVNVRMPTTPERTRRGGTAGPRAGGTAARRSPFTVIL